MRAALEAAGIRYAVGGSWASTAFGEPRFTNDVDILADLSAAHLDEFLQRLPAAFYVDPTKARDSIRLGRPFNVIHIPLAFKFDLFPARAFPLGLDELDRAVPLPGSGLSELPVPFVTPEDILLAKLHWYRAGGEVSESEVARHRRDRAKSGRDSRSELLGTRRGETPDRGPTKRALGGR